MSFYNGCSNNLESNRHSAAQRHANIKMGSELIQLAQVNMFLCTCVFKHTHTPYVANAFTTFFSFQVNRQRERKESYRWQMCCVSVYTCNYDLLALLTMATVKSYCRNAAVYIF